MERAESLRQVGWYFKYQGESFVCVQIVIANQVAIWDPTSDKDLLFRIVQLNSI